MRALVLLIAHAIIEINPRVRRVELVGQGRALGDSGMLKYKPKTAKRLYW